MPGYSDLADFDGADGWASVTVGFTPTDDGTIDVTLVVADGQPPMTAAQLRHALLDVVADLDNGELPEGMDRPVTDCIEIPLLNRAGELVATTVVDPEDNGLASLRWYRLGGGYAVRTVVVDGAKRMLYLHREICQVPTSDRRSVVDHIDRDRLNNRRGNLRVTTNSGNMQNRGPNSDRVLPRNVYRRSDCNGFKVQGHLNGRLIHVGSFPDVESADLAARAWRAENMPLSPDARSV